MTEHLDLDELADLLADEAPAPAHLAGCAACSEQLSVLRGAQEQVRGRLAALPAPALPHDVATRLAAALTEADEAGNPAAGGPAAGAPAPSPITTLPSRAVQTGPARWLPAAAAAVLLFGGAAFGITQLTRDDAAETSTSAAGDAADRESATGSDIVRNDSGSNYTDRDSLAAAVPSLLAGTAQRSAADSRLGAAPPAAAAPGGKTLGTPTPSRDGAGSAPQVAAANADPLARLRETDALADCLLALLPPDDPSVQPLALDYGSFRGVPALVVLLPGGAEGRLDVFVVGAGCSRANDSVVFYASVDAP